MEEAARQTENHKGGNMSKEDLKACAKVMKDLEVRIFELKEDLKIETLAWKKKVMQESLAVNEKLLADAKQWYWKMESR